MEELGPALEEPTPGISRPGRDNGTGIATASPIRRGGKEGVEDPKEGMDPEAAELWKKCKYVTVILIIIAVAVGVFLGLNREDDPPHYYEPMNGPDCSPMGDHEDCSYQHNRLTEYADLPLVAPLKLSARSECDCRDMCHSRGYSIARFERKKGTWEPAEPQHSCQCSSSIEMECLVRFGQGVELTSGQGLPTTPPYGSIMTWDCSLEVCDHDYCELFPNDALCLTGHQLELHRTGWPWLLEDASLPEPTNTSYIDSQYECLEYCASYPLVAHYQEYDTEDDASPYICSCFDDDVTCYLPWRERNDLRVFYPPRGTLHSKSALDKCDVDFEWCDMVPDDIQCFNGTEYNVRLKGWPWQPTSGDYLNTSNLTNATSAEECVQHCLPENQVAVYLNRHDNGLGLNSNCLCYDDDDAMCIMPWGDQVEIYNGYMSLDDIYTIGYVPHGTTYSRYGSPMEDCPDQQTWCDVVPNHWLCSTRTLSTLNIVGDPMELETTLHLQPASLTNASSLPECIEHCSSYEIAVLHDSPNDFTSSNCLCYDEQATSCLLPWGDVESRFIPEAITVFMSGESLPSCEDSNWCDVFPDHWVCLTRNSDYLSGWPRQLEENDYLQTAAQTNTVSEGACIQHCRPYHVAVFLSEPSDLLLDVNCLCYDEQQASCRVRWGDQVSYNVRSYGIRIHSMTGSEMSTCTDVSWCDLNPDHWYCFIERHKAVKEAGWPWQSNNDGFLPAAAQSDTNTREACLDFCKSYTVTVHVNQTEGNLADIYDGNCLCFDEQATCMMSWGGKVKDSGVVPHGDVFAKESAGVLVSSYFEPCRPEFCDVMPNHEFCSN